MTIKMTDPDELYDLMKVLRCLIDTAERTTDLEGAYNDKADEYVSWAEIHKALPQNSEVKG